MAFIRQMSFFDQSVAGIGPVPVGAHTDWTPGATTKNFTPGQVVMGLGVPSGQASTYAALVYLAWVGQDNAGLFVPGDVVSFDVEHYSDASVLQDPLQVGKPDYGFYHFEFMVPANFPAGAMYRHVWRDQPILIGGSTDVMRMVNLLSARVATAPWDVLVLELQSQLASSDFVSTNRPLTSNVKKNQALAGFGFMMFDTNGAPATGKTVTVTRSIDTGTFGAGTLSAVTEIANGWYRVDFAAGDLNGKCIRLRATAAGCKDTNLQILTDA